MTQAPHVTITDRASLIRWHRWNDPNGTYLDAECAAEGMPRWTLAELLAAFHVATAPLSERP